MTTQPEHPNEEPVVEPEAATPAEEEAVDDTLPLTVDEFKDAGREVVDRVKHGFLAPVYRLGRRYIQSIEGAADAFFDGVANDKKGKK